MDLVSLRREIEEINFSILDLLTRRAGLVIEVQSIKSEEGLPTFLPEREQEMLKALIARNSGPFSDETVRYLFKEIFKASVSLMESKKEHVLKTSRAYHSADLCIEIATAAIGREPIVIAGPCAIESEEQMDESGRFLASKGVRFIRGGAFKPRSSPYSFQGLGEAGLKLLQKTARQYGLVSVTEVMDTRNVEMVAQYADVLQIGSRNMYNYELLKEVGQSKIPILLKRGLSATLEEFLWSAEYVVSRGNENVILCERGIRTYETQTRNTLDISAVALLRQKTFLPVIVDVSHAAGRKDILAALGRAALAADANGLMVEVHPCPSVARSDSQQQLDFAEFERFMVETGLDVILTPGSKKKRGEVFGQVVGNT
ncbi:MAG: bifunctional 3-deoxy-7-phosphoheptulonate synthase/chorismate mutase [Pseudomonadota bacterium]